MWTAIGIMVGIIIVGLLLMLHLRLIRSGQIRQLEVSRALGGRGSTNANFQQLPVIVDKHPLAFAIDTHLVRVWKRGIFDSDTAYWEEPVVAYECVMFVRELDGVKETFTVTLKHPNTLKSLTLGTWTRHDYHGLDGLTRFVAVSGPAEVNARRVWRQAAHLLNIPAKEEAP